ncbi:unnamed protein product [Mytilus coruscus]|uniref:Uncharacterized protein n=1 Tax=Mytilus coruscus TaxID=42192 RepID=A0A6J8CKB8_MYTCO|nr:unnamed protein product [Mytilus coruscus]
MKKLEQSDWTSCHTVDISEHARDTCLKLLDDVEWCKKNYQNQIDYTRTYKTLSDRVSGAGGGGSGCPLITGGSGALITGAIFVLIITDVGLSIQFYQRLRHMYDEMQNPTPVINAPLPPVINGQPEPPPPAPLTRSDRLRNRPDYYYNHM